MWIIYELMLLRMAREHGFNTQDTQFSRLFENILRKTTQFSRCSSCSRRIDEVLARNTFLRKIW